MCGRHRAARDTADGSVTVTCHVDDKVYFYNAAYKVGVYRDEVQSCPVDEGHRPPSICRGMTTFV